MAAALAQEAAKQREAALCAEIDTAKANVSDLQQRLIGRKSERSKGVGERQSRPDCLPARRGQCLLQDLGHHGLDMSPGTLAGCLQALAPQFEPLVDAMLAKLRSEQHWHDTRVRKHSVNPFSLLHRRAHQNFTNSGGKVIGRYGIRFVT